MSNKNALQGTNVRTSCISLRTPATNEHSQHTSTHRKARLEPAIRDARKLAQNVFPPWSMQVMQVEGGRKHWKIRFYGIYIGISQLGLRCKIPFAFLFDELHFNNFSAETPGGGRVLGLSFAGYVPLVSRSPYPIPGALPYSCCCLANYRPHLSHFWANVIFAIPT